MECTQCKKQFEPTHGRQKYCSDKCRKASHPHDYNVIVAKADEGSSSGKVGITAITRFKHAKLYEAAQRAGSQKALADLLNVSQQTLGKWINLMDYPRLYGEPHAQRSKEWQDTMRLNLMVHVGETAEDIWPESLRKKRWLSAKKTIEKTQYMEEFAIERYLENQETQEQVQRRLEITDAVDLALKTLPFREREILKKRYGIGCDPMTLEEVGAEFKITQERVRQIESKGIKKLMHHSTAIPLADVAFPWMKEDRESREKEVVEN